MANRPDWTGWKAAMGEVVDRLTATGTCPCAWPRVRHVIAFHVLQYANTPVLCRESELLQERLLYDTALFERLAPVSRPWGSSAVVSRVSSEPGQPQGCSLLESRRCSTGSPSTGG